MEEDEYGNSSNIIAMDYAIAQKILPKINGSGDEYETWLEELEKYCDSKEWYILQNYLLQLSIVAIKK